jgi:hypothetical protein
MILAMLTLLAQDDALHCDLKLKNGSLVKGAFKTVSEIHLKTKYGMLKFPIKDVRTIAWGDVRKEERDTVSAKSGSYQGWIEPMDPMHVDTGYGVLKIPPADIRYARIYEKGAKNQGDDFESGQLDRWSSSGGAWNIQSGQLKAVGSNQYNGMLLYSEEMPDTYTVDVEVGANQGSVYGLVWHAESWQNANVLWINSGQVYVFSGQNWWNVQSAYWNPGQPSRIKLEVDGPNASIFVNDTKVGSVSTGLKSGKLGLFCYSGQATFDNFRILK